MAALALLAGAGVGEAQTVGYTASLYGARWASPTSRLDGLYVFNAVDVSAGPARASLTVPVVRTTVTPVSGDAAVIPVTSSGLADPLLRLDLRVVDRASAGFQLGIAGAVKLPWVDAATGRGTGVADYALGTSVFKAVSRTSLMADLLYWRYGEPPGVEFPDTWSYSAGVAQVVGRGRHSVLASIGGFSTGVGGAPAPVSLTAGVLTLLGARGQSLVVTATKGLNDSASDFSVGTSWRIVR